MDRPTFNIYHANSKGTGMAMNVELHPAEGVKEGCVFLSLARQTSVSRDENPTFPTFGWVDRIIVKLNPIDIEKMLEVFSGMTEAINDGYGLSSTRADGTTTIMKLCHKVELLPCYLLEIEQTENGETDQRCFALSPTEGGMLYHGLVASMGRWMFGDQGYC